MGLCGCLHGVLWCVSAQGLLIKDQVGGAQSEEDRPYVAKEGQTALGLHWKS